MHALTDDIDRVPMRHPSDIVIEQSTAVEEDRHHSGGFLQQSLSFSHERARGIRQHLPEEIILPECVDRNQMWARMKKIQSIVLSRGVRSLFGPTRKSSPWGNFPTVDFS